MRMYARDLPLRKRSLRLPAALHLHKLHPRHCLSHLLGDYLPGSSE
jgi:hypothetical protein